MQNNNLWAQLGDLSLVNFWTFTLSSGGLTLWLELRVRDKIRLDKIRVSVWMRVKMYKMQNLLRQTFTFYRPAHFIHVHFHIL